MLTHANMVETGNTLIKSEDVRLDDNWLAYLPMAWVGDSLYTLVMNLMVGFTVNCPESPETVQRDLRELGPTAVLAPPRIWENMLTGVQVRAADAPRLKRWVFERSVRRRRARGDSPVRRASRSRSVFACMTALGEFFVYRPVRDQLGLRRARWAYTGGAPLGPDTFRFFRSIGVNLKQVYGSTELTGLVSLQPDTEANPTTAGRPCPGIDVKIGDRGEVLVKSAGVFKGYFKNDEATREVIDRRRLVPHRRRRLRRSARPPGHHRPRQGRGRAGRRHRLRAAVHREQAEVQPLHPRGGGLRPRAPVRHRDDRHRPQHRRQLGRAPGRRLHVATPTSARSRRCAA